MNMVDSIGTTESTVRRAIILELITSLIISRKLNEDNY